MDFGPLYEVIAARTQPFTCRTNSKPREKVRQYVNEERSGEATRLPGVGELDLPSTLAFPFRISFVPLLVYPPSILPGALAIQWPLTACVCDPPTAACRSFRSHFPDLSLSITGKNVYLLIATTVRLDSGKLHEATGGLARNNRISAA